MPVAKSETIIMVYTHWVGLKTPVEMGILRSTSLRGKEIFSFEYNSDCRHGHL